MTDLFLEEHKAPLGDVFCSRIRIRILKILSQLGQLNVSDTAHRLSINYDATITHLRILEDNGVVQIMPCERVRLCMLSESLKTKAMQEALEAWQTPNDR